MNPVPPLFKHQDDAVKFYAETGKRCIFLKHDPGCGKTRTVLTIYGYEWMTFHPKSNFKLLVICPSSLVKAAWIEDADRFTNFRCMDMRKPIKVKKKIDINAAEIFIINYELVYHRLDQITEFLRTPNITWMCALDESSKIKNPQSKTTKAILSLRNFFNIRVVGSATPTPNGMHEIWPQIRFLNDDILNRDAFSFKHEYFHLEKFDYRTRETQELPVTKGLMRNNRYMADMQKQGFRWSISAANKSKLLEKIMPVVHSVRKRDCLDLPEMVDVTRSIELGPKQRALYNKMKRDLVFELNGADVVASVAVAKIMKLRQITSGFAIDDTEKPQVLPENRKFVELQELLEELGSRQVIIWCQFHFEIRQMMDLLGSRATTLYGGTKDKDESIEAFKSCAKQYLIAHPRSAAHGLTFVNCDTMIFYALDYSSEAYEQAKNRTHRPGQVNKCTNIHMIAENTIDEQIYDALNRKIDANEFVYKFLGRMSQHA